MKSSEKKIVKRSFEKRKTLRMILLLFAVFTSPLICFGYIILLSAAPDSVLPRLFRGEARVENNSGEILFLTPITTTYGHPEVITQMSFFRQRDIPLEPNQSIVLTYDTADMPLARIAVCRVNQDCRYVDVKNHYSDTYILESIDTLPHLGQIWIEAIQLHPRYNVWFSIPILGFIPVALFFAWMYLGVRDKKTMA